uniref:Delta 5 desaturase n=1 Tax=Lobosphaera incisa TaxID=312850 RepID=D3K946_9CHLO|nr:delta 5 desaturase [Lobosphaera incisa]AEU04699.1 fatty acid delta-5-desaturase [Lobosphaera incisa]AID50177.1 delta-5 fatty acid desaturase [Lobosphaera incisa]
MMAVTEGAGGVTAEVGLHKRSSQPRPAAPRSKLFTLDEVAKHDSPTDCWVVIRRRVYDVTAWVPQHPGGNLIFVKAGRDCTQLFDSYHPLSARAVLDKFYIGEVDVRPGDEQFLVAFEEDTEEGQFYTVLKKRVEKYFRENKLNPRATGAMYAKSLTILAGLALSFYGTFFAFSSAPASLLSAVLLGICMAEVGVSIMHDANHGAFARNTWASHALGATLDIVGASSFMWRQQHVVGHHAYTNVDGQDPDLRVKDPDVRRVTKFQPQQSYQAYQHIYLAFLYGLLAIKSVLLDDFMALSSGAIGSVKVAKLTPGEKLVFWGGKALWLGYFVLLPVVKSRHSWPLLAACWLLSEFVTGWMLAFMFQVAHVTSDVSYLEADKTGKVPRGWAAAQAATTADFAHGSWFWTQISGGLNYQVVHHLFPGICHLHYPAIAPIVLDTCKEFNVPYHVYPTFVRALAAHFKHLKDMGAPTAIPSLATVG